MRLGLLVWIPCFPSSSLPPFLAIPPNSSPYSVTLHRTVELLSTRDPQLPHFFGSKNNIPVETQHLPPRDDA